MKYAFTHDRGMKYCMQSEEDSLTSTWRLDAPIAPLRRCCGSEECEVYHDFEIRPLEPLLPPSIGGPDFCHRWKLLRHTERRAWNLADEVVQ
jgi:hypothetical protein